RGAHLVSQFPRNLPDPLLLGRDLLLSETVDQPLDLQEKRGEIEPRVEMLEDKSAHETTTSMNGTTAATVPKLCPVRKSVKLVKCSPTEVIWLSPTPTIIVVSRSEIRSRLADHIRPAARSRRRRSCLRARTGRPRL